MNFQGRIVWLILRYLLLLLIFFLLLGLLYLSLHGFPDAWVGALENRFSGSDMVVKIQSVKLSVFEGFIVRRVRCYKKGDIGSSFFEVEKIVLKPNPAFWLKGDSGLMHAVIKNGLVRISAPDFYEQDYEEDARGVNKLSFYNVNAVIVLEYEKNIIRVADVTTRFAGINIKGRGVVALPESGRADLVEDDKTGVSGLKVRDGQFLIPENFIKSWESVSSGQKTSLDVEFVIDVNDWRNTELVVQAEARGIASPIKNFSASKCSAYVFLKNGKGHGSLMMANHHIAGVVMESAMGSFDFDDEVFKLRRLNAVIGDGAERGSLSLEMDYSLNAREFNGVVSFDFEPEAIVAPFKTGNSRAINMIEDFRFHKKPPKCDAAFDGVLGADWRFAATGTVSVADFSYRGVDVESLKSGFSLDLTETKRLMSLSPLNVFIDGESSDVELNFDFIERVVAFEGTSTIEPSKTGRIISPFMGRLLNRFRFEGPVNITASGVAGYYDVNKNDINVRFEGERFGWNRFVCDEGSLLVSVSGDLVYVSEIKCSIYDGALSGEVTVMGSGDTNNIRYELTASVEDLDFGSFLHAAIDASEKKYRGRCSASVVLTGVLGVGKGDTVAGYGEIKIMDGHIFQIPLFGGLSDMMTKYVPGISLLLRQTDAKASVVIKDGGVSSGLIVVDGDVFSVRGKGSVSFAGDLGFVAQLVFFRQHTLAAEIMRIITLPVSEIFGFRLDGTVFEPRWRPVYLPKELFLIFGRDDDS